jgi:hypothetical protein
MGGDQKIMVDMIGSIDRLIICFFMGEENEVNEREWYGTISMKEGGGGWGCSTVSRVGGAVLMKERGRFIY